MLLIVAAFALAAIAATIALAITARIVPADAFVASKNRDGVKANVKRQIGGLALAPVLVVAFLAAILADPAGSRLYAGLAVSVAMLTVTGFLDDRRDLAVMPRLTVQILAAALVVWALWPGLTLFEEWLPGWLRFAGFLLVLVWFINLTNFMDGMDLMVATGLGLPLAWIAAIAALGFIDLPLGLVAAVSSGALLAFGRVNWPPASIILGDSGSLPLGLIGGAMFLALAQTKAGALALLPFAYLAADATSTLLVRAWQGKHLLQGHAEHAYQIGRRAGRDPLWIVALICLTITLSGAAGLAALLSGGAAVAVLAVIVASAATTGLILRLRAPRPVNADQTNG